MTNYSQPESHTHLQFAQANATTKNCKRVCLAGAEQNCGNLKGLSRKVNIKVFDIHGNDYRFFEIEGKNNIITEKLDLKELAAGVYFIKFSSMGFNQVRKIVIHKKTKA